MNKFARKYWKKIARRKISISSKITLMVIIETAVIAIIAYYCSTWIGVFNFYAGAEKDIELAVRSVVFQASEAKRLGTPVHWRTVCENVRSSVGVRVQILDSNRRIIFNGFGDPVKGQDIPDTDEIHLLIDGVGEGSRVDYYPSSGMMIFDYKHSLLFVNIVQFENINGKSFEACFVRKTAPQWLIYDLSNKLVILGLVLMLAFISGLNYLWSRYYVFNDFREIVQAVREREKLPWKHITPLPVSDSHDERAIVSESMNRLLNNIVRENVKQNDLLLAVAHDMRTPLSTLKLIMQSIKKKEENNPFISIADNEIDYLEKHINKIHDFIEQPSMNTSDYELVEYSLFLYDDILLPERSIWETKGRSVEFSGQLAHGTGYIAKSFVISILRNIVQNAARFSEEVTGKVYISSRMSAKDLFLTVTIEDNGIGIPQEKIDRIFEPGYKIDEARTRDDEDNMIGHGFGLSIAKKWADLLGITIIIDSELGKGTRVMVKIPVHSAPPDHS